jgi:hypothetical protein
MGELCLRRTGGGVIRRNRGVSAKLRTGEREGEKIAQRLTTSFKGFALRTNEELRWRQNEIVLVQMTGSATCSEVYW